MHNANICLLVDITKDQKDLSSFSCRHPKRQRPSPLHWELYIHAPWGLAFH